MTARTNDDAADRAGAAPHRAESGSSPLSALADAVSNAGGAEGVRALAELMRPVMKAIAGAAGPNCEVVFHDLSGHELEHSIIAIENGHLTGRSVGGPSTNLGLEVLHDESGDHDSYGYRSRTRDGREMRSSSAYFRDADGRVIASLCINVDLTGLQQVQSLIGELLPGAEEKPLDETFAGDITQVLEDLIENAVEMTGKPVGVMERDDKMLVLAHLDRYGAFYVKRAMDRIASRLGMSRVTAYKYLEQIRAEPHLYDGTDAASPPAGNDPAGR